jgi:hypothetical protein
VEFFPKTTTIIYLFRFKAMENISDLPSMTFIIPIGLKSRRYHSSSRT